MDKFHFFLHKLKVCILSFVSNMALIWISLFVILSRVFFVLSKNPMSFFTKPNFGIQGIVKMIVHISISSSTMNHAICSIDRKHIFSGTRIYMSPPINLLILRCIDMMSVLICYVRQLEHTSSPSLLSQLLAF